MNTHLPWQQSPPGVLGDQRQFNEGPDSGSRKWLWRNRLGLHSTFSFAPGRRSHEKLSQECKPRPCNVDPGNVVGKRNHGHSDSLHPNSFSGSFAETPCFYLEQPPHPYQMCIWVVPHIHGIIWPPCVLLCCMFYEFCNCQKLADHSWHLEGLCCHRIHCRNRLASFQCDEKGHAYWCDDGLH